MLWICVSASARLIYFSSTLPASTYHSSPSITAAFQSTLSPLYSRAIPVSVLPTRLICSTITEFSSYQNTLRPIISNQINSFQFAENNDATSGNEFINQLEHCYSPNSTSSFQYRLVMKHQE